jgi:hypothetical protein
MHVLVDCMASPSSPVACCDVFPFSGHEPLADHDVGGYMLVADRTRLSSRR